MKYTPFCSVEIAFGDMQTLRDLINAYKDGEKIAVVCDRFCTDLWEVTDLIEAGVKTGNVAWIDKCPSNPTPKEVVRAMEIVGDMEPTQILAIGGGSTIDVGKSISALYYMYKGQKLTEEMVLEALRNKTYNEPHQFIDIIAVPSTAGTGSEVTQFATVWDMENGAKYSIDTPYNYAKKAYMIPDLTLSMPLRGTLSTGLDALSHAVEAFWAKPTTYVVKDVAIRAIDMIMTYLPQVLKDPNNLELRTAMTRAALLSGMSFARTRTTACHSMGYPITIQCGLEHGFACALTLDAVSKINREKTVLADMLFDTFEKHGGLRKWIDDTCEGIVRLRLKDLGISKDQIDGIVEGTFTKGRMDNNPVDISPEQVKEIFLSIYE